MRKLYQANSQSIVGQADFIELLGVDVPPDATDGQFVVSGNFFEDPAKVDGQAGGYLYSAADVRVVGIVGSQRIVVATSAIGFRKAAYTYAFVLGIDQRSWQRLALEARFILDGTTGADMTTVFAIVYPGTCPIVMDVAVAGFINTREGGSVPVR